MNALTFKFQQSTFWSIIMADRPTERELILFGILSK